MEPTFNEDKSFEVPYAMIIERLKNQISEQALLIATLQSTNTMFLERLKSVGIDLLREVSI